ncbi:hypothetical protein GCM10009727_75490 [Actinomadura napierensis]|uniref:Uncharacterized protein n=1 Tax=Actinomadura napierensis TaxID=267854 RepID=A0ABN3AD36_9ACTN
MTGASAVGDRVRGSPLEGLDEAGGAARLAGLGPQPACPVLSGYPGELVVDHGWLPSFRTVLDGSRVSA